MTDLPKNDSELIQLAKEDPVQFGHIYERYVKKIYTYIYYRTGNVYDAEDLTTNVFIRAMNNLPKYQDRGLPFSSWLYRIAHNLISNWYRDKAKHDEINLDSNPYITEPDSDPHQIKEENENTEILLEAIKTLPPDRQELLILKFVDRLSNRDIGKIMRRSEGAIKSLYHRTLLSLKKEINKNDTG